MCTYDSIIVYTSSTCACVRYEFAMCTTASLCTRARHVYVRKHSCVHAVAMCTYDILVYTHSTCVLTTSLSTRTRHVYVQHLSVHTLYMCTYITLCTRSRHVYLRHLYVHALDMYTYNLAYTHSPCVYIHLHIHALAMCTYDSKCTRQLTLTGPVHVGILVVHDLVTSIRL